MHDGTYKEGEKKQEIQITLRFNVKHNPGNEGHLKMLAMNYLHPKGIKVFEENGILIIE